MKCMKTSPDPRFDKNLKFYHNETKILKTIQHIHLIKIFEFFENCEKIKKNGEKQYFNAIIFELAANGDLFEFINSEKFSEDLARTYFHQLIEGFISNGEDLFFID